MCISRVHPVRTMLKGAHWLPQNSTILLAGYDTSGSSLVWTSLELARHPEMQSKLRCEIRQKAREIQKRGDTEFSALDLESMPYLAAVLKVC